MIRDYELRERYDLNSFQEKQVHASKMFRFIIDVLHEVKNYHFRRNMKHIERAADKNPILRTVTGPVAVAAGSLAIDDGQSIDLSMDEETRIRVRTALPEQEGEIHISSPIVTGTLTYDGKS